MAEKPKKSGRQYKYDWELISTDYIQNSGMSLTDISEKYGVTFATVKKHSSAEGWVAARKKYQKKLRQKVGQKVDPKKVDNLAELVKASDIVQQKILSTLQDDPAQFHRHIVSHNKDDEEEVLELLNYGAMKDMMRVIKDIEDVKRSILSIEKEDTESKRQLEREKFEFEKEMARQRLELEKERIALERERNALRSQNMNTGDEESYGIVLLPEVITDA